VRKPTECSVACSNYISYFHFIPLKEVLAGSSTATLLSRYCDNKSLVQVVSANVNRTRQEYVNETMESEWDVVQAIVKCIKQLGTVDLRHVKGHQTEKSGDQPLPLSAKLNNEAMPLLPLSKSTPTTRTTSSFPLPGHRPIFTWMQFFLSGLPMGLMPTFCHDVQSLGVCESF
jgi:hypothetical protein